MQQELKIPDTLLTQIREQRTILFLGAGASLGADHPKKKSMLSCDDLRNKLSDKFLSGDLKNRTLQNIADIIINEYDLNSLQSYVNDLFEPYQPSAFHKLIPTFPWQSIITTNYDLIIERAYQSSNEKVREIIPYLKHGEKIDQKLGLKANSIAYIKLHGCISQHRDHSIPLILSKEQLARHKKNRIRLFDRLKNLAEQFNFIFCGYSINDPHIAEILFDLTDQNIERPRYYLISPNQTQYDINYWNAHRISVINNTFESFIMALDKQIPTSHRKLSQIVLKGETSLAPFYKVTDPSETEQLISFLDNDVHHVKLGILTTKKAASDFYTGYDNTFWPIEQHLDIERRITDSIIVESILEETTESTKLYLIKGPAGNGKTVTLKRVAWEAAHSYEKLTFYLRDSGSLKFDALQEIYDLTGKRTYIFIDHAALHVDEILNLIQFSNGNRIPITILLTERDNEWNTRCGILDGYLQTDFSIPYLSSDEIKALLVKLETAKCLGHLEELNKEQRYQAFHDRAQRQLLVALHETTMGKPFEEIVLDEYDRIVPEEARLLYLDICTFNKLGVPVRAGLIHRVSGISLSKFKEHFFSPLEHIVRFYMHSYIPDAMYEARHAHVAEIVFENVLRSPEERYDQIVRLLSEVNIEYASDLESFRTLMRGHMISELFQSYELGYRLFNVAFERVGEDPFLLQQLAIFEMDHGDNLMHAEDALIRAMELAPWDRTIKHSYSNLCRRKALQIDDRLEKANYRSIARKHIRDLKQGPADHSFAHNTAIQLALDEFRELLIGLKSGPNMDSQSQRLIEEKVKVIEENLTVGLQQFPNNEQLLVIESEFRNLINDNEAALAALQKAFNRNQRSEFIASRLVEILIRKQSHKEACEVMQKCLEKYPDSKLIHLKLALFYMKNKEFGSKFQILDHLRRSYSPGDGKYEARFWHARELFAQKYSTEAVSVFVETKAARLPPKDRRVLRGFLDDNAGNKRIFEGEILRIEPTFCLVSCPEYHLEILCHSSKADEKLWSFLKLSDKVEYSIGFSMIGPEGVIHHRSETIPPI